MRQRAVVLDFLRSETAGGLALIGAAVAAMAWANSSLAGVYFELLALPAELRIGAATLAMPLDEWINNGLMAVFFLTVGLEIRREMTEGELASRARALLPAIAALGGMIGPALIYIACCRGNPQALSGWAVPVATDIAFVLAALSVLGRRAPLGLKIFLTALSILDDLGAIAIIALFYTGKLNWRAAILAGFVWLVLLGLRRAGVRAVTPYILGGVVAWAFVLRSGVHPTLAGVALAFIVPRGDGERSPARRLEQALGGWVTWLVLPLFGLANAGVRFAGLAPAAALSPAVLGTVLGLVIGKQAGVFGATMAALRLGIARLPAGVSTAQLYGGAVLCGIGFTMSLFIGDLSFRSQAVLPVLKLGVFAASLTAAVLGLGVLIATTKRREPGRPLPVVAPQRERSRP